MKPSCPGCWAPPCAPAATSPRCSSRTSAPRRPVSTTARSRSSPPGRDRGAGIRVVVGDTTGFAHTADLSEAGPAGRGRGRGRRGQRRGRRHARRRPHPAATPRATTTSRSPPGDVAKATKVELLRRADEAARGRGRRHQPGDAPATATAAAGSSSPTATACSPSDDQVRTLFVVGVRRRRATPACRPAGESIGHTIGFELFDRYDVEELADRAAERALTKLAARPAPSGEMPVVIGTGGGGVLFHEACGHGLEADLVDKDASVFTGRVGEQVAVAARHAGRRRHHGRRVGLASPSTTRARPPSATC